MALTNGSVFYGLDCICTSYSCHQRQLNDGQNPYNQIVYVTDESDKFFLSRQGCIDLGMISDSFPTVGEVKRKLKAPEYATALEQIKQPASAMTSNCSCLQRQKPPPKPTKLPLPATEENREKLESWLREYYASSSFNTCQHQPLPVMETKPLRLMIEQNAKPVAHHTPVPVPVHW